MTDDQTFRAALIIGHTVLFPLMLYHRRKAHVKNETLDRRQEGLVMLVTLRLAGLAIFGGLIAYVISPSSVSWAALSLPAWVRWTGVFLGAAGLSLLAWTLRNLGPNLTDTVVTRARHSLVTGGPYRWVRHPFYDSAALWSVGGALAASNWYLIVAGVTLFALFAVRTRREEERLIARFGDGYRAYMARTGRFLPILGRRPLEA